MAMVRWMMLTLAAGMGLPAQPVAPEMTAALNAARAAAVRASLAEPLNETELRAKVDAIGAAELALAMARADRTAPAAGAGRGGRGPQNYQVGGGTIPNVREPQTKALTQLTTGLMPLTRALNGARAALVAASVAEPRNDAAIRAKVEEVVRAELAVATARAAAFARIQGSANRLAPNQVAAFAAMGGTFAGVAFTLPEAMNFGRARRVCLAVRRSQPEGVGRESEILAGGGRSDRRRIDAAESKREFLPGLPGSGGEGLHA